MQSVYEEFDVVDAAELEQNTRTHNSQSVGGRGYQQRSMAKRSGPQDSDDFENDIELLDVPGQLPISSNYESRDFE